MATWVDWRDDIIPHILRQKVTTKMNTWLSCPLLIIEIWDALSKRDATTYPGINGLTPQFFTSLWDIIKEDILHVYEEIITSDNMPREFV